MARKGAFPKEPSRRLDRILLRSSIWKAEGIRILGDAPVSPETPDVFPSDHFGLACTLKGATLTK